MLSNWGLNFEILLQSNFAKLWWWISDSVWLNEWTACSRMKILRLKFDSRLLLTTRGYPKNCWIENPNLLFLSAGQSIWLYLLSQTLRPPMLGLFRPRANLDYGICTKKMAFWKEKFHFLSICSSKMPFRYKNRPNLIMAKICPPGKFRNYSDIFKW